jgi:hypothetical protein
VNRIGRPSSAAWSSNAAPSGFMGFALHKNDAEPAEGHLTRDTSSETIQAALEKAEAALEAKLNAKGK